MIPKIFYILVVSLFVVTGLTFQPALAQETDTVEPQATDIYYISRVLEVIAQGTHDFSGSTSHYQKLIVEVIRGSDKGKRLPTEEYTYSQDQQRLEVGDKVIVTATKGPNSVSYYVTDKYRIPSVVGIFVIFFCLAVAFARRRGFMSIVGLMASLFLLMWFMVPRILAGDNPLFISLVTAVMIALLSLYLAHGFSARTTIAVISTLTTLSISVVLALFFVQLGKLSGLGTEEATYLQFGATDQLNLQGLLLGGIIISVLGVLDDVTTAQVAAVGEIRAANPTLPFTDLYRRGLVVGREHVVSLVNTLALAYAGASLPLFLVFAVNKTHPFWLLFNSEFIVEEIIRTLVGSSSLILAVPISTFLAARYLGKYEDRKKVKAANKETPILTNNKRIT
jgi:uncharacterized membrane protein